MFQFKLFDKEKEKNYFRSNSLTKRKREIFPNKLSDEDKTRERAMQRIHQKARAE